MDDLDENSSKKAKTVCAFCLSSEGDETQFGEILSKEEITCHYFCLLLASGLYQNAKPNEKSSIRGFLLSDIRKEIKRGFRLKCFYCQEKGATLGCCAKKCKKAFHLPCGRANGSLHQFVGGFGSYCGDHCPKQSFSDECDERTDELLCNICLSPLGESSLSSINILHSPCCNNSQFHRKCIQQYATSAGMHHFRCPLCNCGEKFLDEMQKFGVYVPDQDASWERQSDAFNELLERHNRCDAEICSCPLGRNHVEQSGKYDLRLCSCCGSVGSHRTCRGLIWCDSSLMCPMCAEIEKELEPERRARLKEAMASGSSRAINSQSEAGPSSTMQENVIHLEMADDEEDIDIDGDIHVPPFLRNSLSRKILRRALLLPSCSLVLQKVDEVINMSQDTINVNKIPGFTYFRRKGYLIKNADWFKKCLKAGERNDASGKVENVQNTSSEMQVERENQVEGSDGKKNTYIKQFDGERQSQEEAILRSPRVKGYSKKRRGRTFNYTPRRRLRPRKGISKARTSPLSSLKKQKALKFLMHFNQSAQKVRLHRPYQKRKSTSPITDVNSVSQSNPGKRLVQSTLIFFKASSTPRLPHDENEKYDGTKATMHRKEETKTGKDLDNPSVSSPCKRGAKVGEGANRNVSVETLLNTNKNVVNKASIEAKLRRRLAPECEVAKNELIIRSSPHKRKLKSDEDKCNDSIATTPHKRVDKAICAEQNENLGEKEMEVGEENEMSIATTPHKRAVKSIVVGQNHSSVGAMAEEKENEKENDTSIVNTPRKRATKSIPAEQNHSCVELTSGENENETSIATTPHKRVAKIVVPSMTSPCKRRLDMDKVMKDKK